MIAAARMRVAGGLTRANRTSTEWRTGKNAPSCFCKVPLSPLYARIADVLEHAGNDVHRINLCFGDWLHWRRPGAVSFRGSDR